MPEGDTVWRVAKTLHKALAGARVTTDFRVPQLATTELVGTVTESASRGKHLLTRFDTGDTLHTHLKMEGSWHLYRPGEGWRRPAHEARVVLTGEEWTAVGFALGVVELVRTDAEDTVVGHLGPDLLGPDWDPAEAVRRLASDPSRALADAPLDQRNLAGAENGLSAASARDRQIADALIDQRCLAGIGNLYKSETLFLAGVSPFLSVAEVPDLHKVVRIAHRLLFANRERVEQATTGDLRRGKQHWVYRRENQPCRRCGTRIRATQQGPAGQERATYWCPRCQPSGVGGP